MKRLADLRPGQRAHVVTVDADDPRGMRILEMGVTPGVEMAMIGAAPLGDPLEFELRGYRLSLRKSEAALIHVEIRP